MLQNKKIAVVVPAYKVIKHIGDVIAAVPEYVDNIIVIDDACPQFSGKKAEAFMDSRVHVIYHKENRGVGAAVISGYSYALSLQADIVVKIDGDDQMDQSYLKELLNPLLEERCDYSKGNRFKDFKALKKMPKMRLFGNSILSFLVKISSGYWNIMDPTNGFTAISKEALEAIELDKLSERYFFESDMLIHLNIQNQVVRDVSIPARYNDEESSLQISKVMVTFPEKLLSGLMKRVLYRYFIYNFNMASVYLLFGLPMVFGGALYGSYRWILGAYFDVVNSTGTVMLSVLPVILGTQFLLQAVSIDITDIPKKVKD